MAKVVPNKKEEPSVKITVDASELDCTIEKIERIRNALEEISGLMSDIFTLKSAPAESEQNYESLIEALFESALSCENAKEDARIKFRHCFALDGSQSVGNNYLKDKRNILCRRMAEFDILINFIRSNDLLEKYQKYKLKEVR